MSLTDDEKLKQNTATTNKMFDIAECCVMQYMSQHFSISTPLLFINSDTLQNKTKPLVLNAIPSYSDNLLVLQIAIVPYNYVCNIPDALKDDASINSMIGFIYHSVINVYNTILNINISPSVVQKVINASVHLEMDDDALSMYPIYIYPERRKQLMFLQMKDDLEKMLTFCSTSNNDDAQTQGKYVQTQYDNLLVQLNDITYDVAAADTLEKSNNTIFATNDRIGIVFTEVKKCDIQNYL